ncbi:hypothetical protein [Bacteroides sp.]|uniref:hypothetical protein n=1 Tax=Bacteroides sp. TaxID=29523 RepID=UPI002616D0B8|nr:hypothetical protein [Bacteroides sp.]MDD3040925.1 hypothetical protein [Bacteroides sp.]
MEMYGKIRCVTFPELVSQGGILSIPSYKKKVREGKLRVVRPGKGAGSCALIDYNTLPELIRQAYDRLYPNAKEELKEQFMSNFIKSDSKAIEFYKTYKPAISLERQSEYVLNVEVMNEMFRVEKETEAMHKKCGYIRKSVVWETVLGTCEKLRERYNHTLPANATRLRQKYNAYKRMGYVALVNRNTGNQAARIILADEARLLLKLRRSIVPRYTESQIFEEYNRQAVERGLNTIKSPTTVKNYLNDPAVMPMWYAAVYGMQKWKAKYASLLKTDLPQMRDALWYGDGTKINLYYRDANNKMCTTSAYEVMDAYSETLIGYDIAPHENFENQYRAYRMAVEFAGVRPYEIVTDNQGSHNKLASEGFFKKICRLHKPTMPYNGQSKSIESTFGRFQQQVLHKLWFFTGQNVTAKKLNSKPNLEFIEENAYALPTLEEMKKIYKQCREEWNNSQHPATGISRIEMYQMSENPEAQPITDADIVQMFWLTTAKPITYTNDGVKPEINKKKYHYDVYATDGMRDVQWALRNTGRSFQIMYDPMDMTRIELWEVTSGGLKYSTTATPKVTVSRATQERTTGDTSFIFRTIEQNRLIMAAIQLEGERFDLDEHIAAELFGLSTPKPKNISKKKMGIYREQNDRGELDIPLSLPQKRMQEEEETDMALDYSTTGEYTKTVSNLTIDDVYNRF